MSTLAEVILRDTRANQPAAGSTPAGTLYYVTDESVMERCTGSAWEDVSAAGSGGMTNPMTTTGDVIYSSDGSGTPARLAAGDDDDVLTLASGVPTWAAPSGGGSGSYIYSSKLTASGGATASFDFTSIPGTGQHLVIDVMSRGLKSAAYDDLYLRLNNDSGSNYDWQSLGAYATTTFGVGTLAATQVTLGQPAAASGVANAWSHHQIKIPNYASTGFHKVVNVQGGEKTAASVGSFLTRQTMGFWRNTAAVTRVTLLFAGGNIANGSIATLHLINAS